jgi:hypothetical protein
MVKPKVDGCGTVGSAAARDKQAVLIEWVQFARRFSDPGPQNQEFYVRKKDDNGVDCGEPRFLP